LSRRRHLVFQPKIVDDDDFLNEMAVQYVPPRRAEPIGRHASAPIVPTQQAPSVKTPPATQPASPKALEAASPSRLSNLTFLEENNENSGTAGGWGDDDFDMDLDDEPKEPVVKNSSDKNKSR